MLAPPTPFPSPHPPPPLSLLLAEAPSTSTAGAEVGPGGGFDPEQLASRVRQFVDMMSGFEGAEVPEADLQFDEGRFAAELERVLGVGLGAGMGAGRRGAPGGDEDDDEGSDTTDEGSSFFSPGTSEDDEQEGWQGMGALGRAAAERWETLTATDSDDGDDEGEATAVGGEGGGGFMSAYSAALEAQLAGTKMVESFQRVGGGAARAPAAAEGPEGGELGDRGAPEGLAPVDVDMNLVNSLLASYGEQAGMPGPATSLAGLLGLRLPDPRSLK
jgi:hypothetical protein